MNKTSAPIFVVLLDCLLLQIAPATNAAGFKEKVLYSFCSQQQCTDGKSPQYNGLIDVSGTLYGATQAGGDTDWGTVFAIDPKTGSERVIHSFNGHPDGGDPVTDLIDVNGILYGTTNFGGVVGCFGDGCGTVFSLDPITGAETVLHSFGETNDGAGPMAGLVAVNRTLYGTTLAGGEHDQGTVFSLDLSTGEEKVLHSFPDDSNDGFFPEGGLMAWHGKLYGTANFGGFFGGGAIFSIDPKTGAEKVVYSFCAQFGCPDGEYPHGQLIASNGTLYGTTSLGGTDCTATRPTGCGTVFAFDPKSHVQTLLHAFTDEPDGKYPLAGLAAVGDTLYGTTSVGGNGNGTVFSIDLSTGLETVLHAFGGGAKPDASEPESGLTAVKGALYGTALSGGANNFGAVFVLKKKN